MRRWTLYRLAARTGRNPDLGGWELRPPRDEPGRVVQTVEVMPVSDHEEMVARLRQVLYEVAERVDGEWGAGEGDYLREAAQSAAFGQAQERGTS